MAEKKAIYIITGVMAAGKSTIAQLLAERLDKSVHVRGDLFRRMIVSGREDMSSEPSPEALGQLQLRYRLAATVAEEYYEAGFNVVLQDVIIGPVLNDMLLYLNHRPLYLVVLDPNAEAVAARDAARHKTGYGGITVSALQQVLQADTPRIGLWIDSSGHTPDETVDEILRRVHAEGEIR
ncbi:AAA family ATPase [Paenibacillus nasutitermitis]|uniref:Phosphotransferase n=1 Tax=Paenibacillus nasutitermitis TaxID=1652958 RepID=A0A917DXT4_9BACL|nr:AAA family ATPase [Paenibacillus nasutitermitis]GGD77829.1 hypothetical protein GCM10010911_39750 [Paenibacillus nasutitermitis]